MCVLQGTSLNDGPVTGTVTFVQMDNGDLNVTIDATGLLDGDHAYHVHNYGNIDSDNGMATGGHFVGQCDACRPDGKPQEVGLLNNGTALVVTGGSVSFWYIEEVAKLSGVNSIEGRAVIIHGNAQSASARVAQCVIGRMTGNTAAPCEWVLALGHQRWEAVVHAG